MAAILALSAGLAAPVAEATITGQVIDSLSGQPVTEARVRIQTTTDDPVLTGTDGLFTLSDVPAGTVTVTAVVSYDPDRAINYITAAGQASDGDHLVLALTRLPPNREDIYDPGTSFSCATCHQDQHNQWLGSTHSGAAVNEWVLDLFSGTGTPGGDAGYVFRDSHDPGDTGFCATCHAPLEDVQTPGGAMLDEVSLAGGLDGVTCLACHQVAHVNDNVSALHHLGNAEYRFPDEAPTELWVWGPLDDVSFGTMRASHQPGFSNARFCASCHEYDNPTTGAPGQNTYTEWLAGPFSQPGENFRACQDCHMPPADEPGPISSLGTQPERVAEQRRDHRFIGATPTTLSNAIELELEASQVGNELEVIARVTNAGAGHHFPTGISIRNALLVITASVDGLPLNPTGGDTIPFYGSAQTTDTDDDLAGQPGKGFARILEGRINGQGPIVRPVLFIDAEDVWADTRIPSGSTDISSYRFALNDLPVGSEVDITARLLYRRAFRDLVVTKGWTTTPTGGPIEIEVASQSLGMTTLPPPREVPVLAVWGVLVLVLGVVIGSRIKAQGSRRKVKAP